MQTWCRWPGPLSAGSDPSSRGSKRGWGRRGRQELAKDRLSDAAAVPCLPCQDAALSLIQALNSNYICCGLIIVVNLVFLFESCEFLLSEIVPAAG